jgi:hypothetical protein
MRLTTIEPAGPNQTGKRHDRTIAAFTQPPQTRKRHFTQDELKLLGIEPSPAFVREPEGNGVAERFIRTLKEQLLWVRTFDTVEDLRVALLEFQDRYNRECDAPTGGRVRLRSTRCPRNRGRFTPSLEFGGPSRIPEGPDAYRFRPPVGLRHALIPVHPASGAHPAAHRPHSRGARSAQGGSRAAQPPSAARAP